MSLMEVVWELDWFWGCSQALVADQCDTSGNARPYSMIDQKSSHHHEMCVGVMYEDGGCTFLPRGFHPPSRMLLEVKGRRLSSRGHEDIPLLSQYCFTKKIYLSVFLFVIQCFFSSQSDFVQAWKKLLCTDWKNNNNKTICRIKHIFLKATNTDLYIIWFYQYNLLWNVDVSNMVPEFVIVCKYFQGVTMFIGRNKELHTLDIATFGLAQLF